MAHKSAHYVAFLLNDALTPDAAEAVLHLLLCGDLPELDTLDEWWVQIVRRRRREVALDLIDEFGLVCECCGIEPSTDLHEVFIKRGANTSWEQIKLFSRANCCVVCRGCHESGAADSIEFQERIRVLRG